MPKIIVDHALCKKDGACVEVCVLKLFARDGKDSVPSVSSEEFCISCGHCVAICPGGAISHDDFPNDSIKPIHQELMPSAEQVAEMLRARRSIREFTDKPVERQLIEKIIDGARFAPSGCNVQSTEFVVVQDKAILNRIVERTSKLLTTSVKGFHSPVVKRIALLIDRDAVAEGISSLPVLDRLVIRREAGEDSILHGAPVIIVFHGAAHASWSMVNATLALYNASLTAQTLGVGSVFLGVVVAAAGRDKRIGKLLSIPADHRIHGVLALGYPKLQYKNWIERKPSRAKWI